MYAILRIANLIFFASAALPVIYGRTLATNRKGWLYRDGEPAHFWFVVGYHFRALLWQSRAQVLKYQHSTVTVMPPETYRVFRQGAAYENCQ